ncbi:LysR family transcriptional regulator [Amycolatopsis sp. WAC 01375]|uniref:LysR family transcriptional regulator n=1 Tax=Amycolatopsis sp. WAC 01375 TaxID=2203194 RepID=UPI000F7B6C52|nr:LysR family transcriptional regulator [Amycolatopsis sp. WAC 01375]RSM69336.1 LysR family transcriptional regulator [Amycolatopsis sp. WAC 01375]
MEIQVRHLRVICEIASHGSLNRAAAGLGLGQPALSHQLRRIERMVGGPLFHRDQRGVRPTELGALILRRAKVIVLTFDELEHDFHRRGSETDTSIRIGWNDSALASPLLGGLRDLFTDRPVRTRADSSRTRLLAQVSHRAIDLALIMICGKRVLPVPPGVRTMTLVREPSFVAVPAGHRLATGKEIDLAELAGEDWIVSSGGDGCRAVFREMCLAHGFDPRITHDVDVDVTREHLVAGGYGVSLVQPTRPEVDGLVIRPLTGSPMKLRHVLAWHEAGPCVPGIQELAAGTSAEYRRMAERSAPYRTWLERHGEMVAG